MRTKASPPRHRPCLLAALLAGVVTFPSHAAEGDKASGEVMRAGICIRDKVVGRYENRRSTAGYSTRAQLRIDRQTRSIPLEQGIGFGFSWKATGLAPSGTVTVAVDHPKIVRPDGKMSVGFRQELPYQSRKGTVDSIQCYFLSEKYEMASGPWTISILSGETVLASKTFKVASGR